MNDYLAVWPTNLSPDWLAVRESLKAMAGGKEILYHPLPHPDFASWPVLQPCTERAAMILDHLKSRGESLGSVLDLGCHTGGMFRALGRSSMRYYLGIDNNSAAVRIARMFSDSVTGTPEFECHTVMWYLLRRSKPIRTFDTCLYFGLIMHTFARSEPAAWDDLQVASIFDRMFLDCVWGDYAKHLPFTPETIGPMIVERTTFTHFKLLGYTPHENRPFYVFWKES